MTETKFLQYIKTNEQKLFRFALRMLKDVNRAEDAMQDLVIKLWKKKDNLQELKNIDAFLMVAMKNHCYDEIKKTKRRRNHYENHKKVRLTKNDSVTKKIEQSDLWNHVKELIEELPETQKMLMQLRDIEQLEMKEIEEITGMQSGAIRTNLSRARKTIRQQIKQLNHYGLE